MVAKGEGTTTEIFSVPRVSMRPTYLDEDMSSSTQIQWFQKSSKQDCRVVDLFSQIEMNFSHLAEEEQQSLKLLLALYSALDPSELGTTQLVTHSIDTGTHPPIKQQVRQTPFTLRKKVDQLVQEMLDQKVIEPSESPWASPIVLVQKNDGGVRFCVDCRKLNRVTKLAKFLLPRIDDTLDQQAGSRHFSTLDLASGYWQVEVGSSSMTYLAYTRAHRGCIRLLQVLEDAIWTIQHPSDVPATYRGGTV